MRMHLGEAFGWEFESKNLVAIAQLQRNDCPKRMLIKNRPERGLHNIYKIVGYIPLVHIIMGIAFIAAGAGMLRSSDSLDKKVSGGWILRGIVVVSTGPLMLVVDLAKTLFDQIRVSHFIKKHPEVKAKFNTTHQHNQCPWPGHPVDCFDTKGEVIRAQP